MRSAESYSATDRGECDSPWYCATLNTGLIEIRAKPHNGTLRIQVRDNGPGLPAHRTFGILFKKGLGLANTETRLEHLYGAAHLFDLTNDPDGGLVVTLEIPFSKDAAAVSHSEN